MAIKLYGHETRFVYVLEPLKPIFSSITHCVKSIQIGSFSGPYFSVFGPEKTPYLDTFHTVVRSPSFILLAKDQDKLNMFGVNFTLGMMTPKSNFYVFGRFRIIIKISNFVEISEI